MKTSKLKTLLLAIALATTIPVVAQAADQAPTLAQQIEAAKAAGDHQALARYYDEQAAAARDRLKEHRELKRAYEQSSYVRYYYDEGGGHTGVQGHIPSEGTSDASQHMSRHCDLLIRNDEEAVQTYAAMAEAHRQFAKQAAQTGAK